MTIYGYCGSSKQSQLNASDTETAITYLLGVYNKDNKQCYLPKYPSVLFFKM